MFRVMCYLFDRSFASSVVNSTLATTDFEVPFVKRFSRVSFVAGQPLGYHASWPHTRYMSDYVPLFALTHHILVWWCAEQVYPGQLFPNYAILGDDVVIADEEVAKVYSSALGYLGLSISWSKSLVSHSGAADFASMFKGS